MRPVNYLLLCLIFCVMACQSATSDPEQTEKTEDVSAENTLLFVGTYTPKESEVDGKANGIYVYEIDNQTAALTLIDTINGPINPSYLAFDPSGEYLFAANEIADGSDAVVGALSSFKIDRDSKRFQYINTVSSAGDAPCHLIVLPDSREVVVANYVGGNVALVPYMDGGQLASPAAMKQHEGSGPNAGRQKAPHAHMVKAFPGQVGGFVAVDLGIDQIIHYQVDENTKAVTQLTTTGVTPGAGPRHLDFHPSQPWSYVLSELNHSIEVFYYKDIATPFERKQIISTLADTSNAVAYPAAIKIHPNGKFLYASNRGQTDEENSIAMFSIAPEDGQLTFLGIQPTKGNFPRDFEIDPSGKHLYAANQRSDNIVVFEIDQMNGQLKDTGLEYKLPAPVCLKFLSL